MVGRRCKTSVRTNLHLARELRIIDGAEGLREATKLTLATLVCDSCNGRFGLDPLRCAALNRRCRTHDRPVRLENRNTGPRCRYRPPHIDSGRPNRRSDDLIPQHPKWDRPTAPY